MRTHFLGLVVSTIVGEVPLLVVRAGHMYMYIDSGSGHVSVVSGCVCVCTVLVGVTSSVLSCYELSRHVQFFFFSFFLSFPLQLANLYLSWGRMEEVSEIKHCHTWGFFCKCVYVCVCSYTHTYAHTHTHIYTHTHTHTHPHTHKGRGQLKGDNEGSCSTRCGSGQYRHNTVTNKPVYRLVFGGVFVCSFCFFSLKFIFRANSSVIQTAPCNTFG